MHLENWGWKSIPVLSKPYNMVSVAHFHSKWKEKTTNNITTITKAIELFYSDLKLLTFSTHNNAFNLIE